MICMEDLSKDLAQLELLIEKNYPNKLSKKKLISYAKKYERKLKKE